MTAQDLKNSILQLAVQGKLVSQDPSDEPTSELLERIKRYRETAIKKGTLSIDKKHTADPILENDIPYDLPNSWKWVRFADIVTFNSGKTPARQETTNWSNGVCPWVSIADMVADGITVDTKEMVSEKAISESFSGKISPVGTMIMSFKLTIGKMSILGINAVHNEAIISIFPTVESKDEDVIKAYLFKILPLIAITGDSKNAVKGKTLNATSISNLMIPLPPLAEQERIVAKIEELLSLVENYGEAEERLKVLNAEFPDKLRKSILQQAVQGKLTECDPADEPASELLKRIRAEKTKLIAEGKVYREKELKSISYDEIPFDIPDEWEWCKLGELTRLITKGSSPSWQGVSYTTEEKGILFVTSENVGVESMLLEKRKYVETKFNDMHPSSILQKGDLLTNIVGASIGRTALFDEEIENANINQAVCIIRLVNNCLTDYLLMYLNSATAIQIMTNKSVDSARANLSLTSVTNLMVPLPPLAEQKRIVARVEELFAVCDGLK